MSGLMAESPLQDLPEGNLNQPESNNPANDTAKKPDPIFANLKYTDSCYIQEDESITLPKLHVMNRYYFDIYGVDTIWHNMYLGPDSDWTTMRQQYDATIEQMLQLVGKHIADGLYGIISLNASKHSLTVICACHKMRDDLPDEMWVDPVDLKAFPWRIG